ncbi:ATPase V1 complex subunit H [Blastocladiella britannica]|nr:ATPase V1 complex subunit H [Blastocladiella britannica]
MAAVQQPTSLATATGVSQNSTDVPVIFAFSDYLDDLHRSVRGKAIPWDGYQRAAMISDADMALISAYDRLPAAQQLQAVLDQPNTYFPLLVRLLSAVLREDTVQYLLALIDDLLSARPADFAPQLHKLSVLDSALPWAPFMKLVAKDDPFTALASAKILTTLLCTYNGPDPVPVDLGPYLSVLAANLRSSNTDTVDLAVQNLQSLLSVPSLRLPIYDFQGGKLISGLQDVLVAQPMPQLQYQAIFCFWLLSFDPNVAREMEPKFHLITPVTDVAKGATKEKVIRVVMALFRNLVTLAPAESTVPLIGNKLLPFFDVLKQRKLADSEVGDDLDFLQAYLREALQRLSSFDEYVGEVQSGKLEWSPAHESELFWKANAAKLAERDGELVRALARVLMTSSDSIVLAVAAHDLGQFIKYYAQGKKILQEIGAKHRLMEMMSHENADVRYQALMAVQKLVSQSWDM